MMANPIIESGMTFGPFPEGHCFYIEKSAIYQRVKDGLQVAEFLLLRFTNGVPPTVWIVEAKSSSPRADLEKYIYPIRQKLTNALSLAVAAFLKRHEGADAELSDLFMALDLAVTDFRLVLVIKDHKKEWLPPLRDALRKALTSVVKTWALPPTAVQVINDAQARTYGLIRATVRD